MGIVFLEDFVDLHFKFFDEYVFTSFDLLIEGVKICVCVREREKEREREREDYLLLFFFTYY